MVSVYEGAGVMHLQPRHHRLMTARERIKVVAELANQGKTYREIADLLRYQSSGSVSRIMRDAKAQGLIKE